MTISASSSSPQRDLFVSVDGPGGAGKTTIVGHLAPLLAGGPHNRYQLMPDSSHTEVAYYGEAANCLQAASYIILRIDCTSREPQQTAAALCGYLLTLSTMMKAAC